MNFNFFATKWALDHLPSLPNSSSRLVFLNLAGRFNENEGASRPGVDRIASDVGATPRTVQRALRTLEKIGILRTQCQFNKPSLYFLNFDFVCAEVGDKKSPQNKKVEQLGVTKSRAGGDFLSPPEVTESHPNKSVNKLLKKQQQPVVVVFEKLIWEKPLAESEKTACEILLAAAELPSEICQKFADEMTGHGRREPIRNPVGWMKNMVYRYGRPGFSFTYADLVAAGRAGRAAQAERENLALPPPPRSAPPAVLALSPTGRAELAKMGRNPKPAPPQVEATHAAANLADAACKSAIAVANLSGEATPATGIKKI